MSDYEKVGATAAEDKPKKRGPSIASKVAAVVMQDVPFVQDRFGNLYSYNGRHWSEETRHTLRRRCLEAYYDITGRDPSPKILQDGEFLLNVKAHRSDFEFGNTLDHEVACENCVVDAITCKPREHVKEDFLENVLKVSFDRDARCEKWMAALQLWFEDDIDKLDALQEFFGYVILPRATYKKALMLIGPGDCGKSQIVGLLRNMVGAEFTCRLSIEHMDNEKLCSVIKGKRLNIMTELSSRALMADGGFKTMVSTEEPILIDRKYKDQETIVPRAKHVIATNELPRLRGRAREVFRRLLVIPMKYVLKNDEQDPLFLQSLQAEMPGILNWALEGAKRLLDQNGVFTDVSAAIEVLEDWEAENDPFLDWFNENMAKEGGARTPLAAIARHYNDRRFPGHSFTSRHVGHRLRNMGLKQHIKKARVRDSGATKRNPVQCLFDYNFVFPDASQIMPSETAVGDL